MIYRIFRRPTIEAIVHWGFKSRSPLLKNLDRNRFIPPGEIPAEQSWAKGIVLTRLLMTRLSLGDINHIRRPLKTRLWIMFGPAYSKVASNNALQKANHSPLSYYVAEANRICDGELFQIDDELLGDDPVRSTALLLAIFGDAPSTNKHTQETADVRLWADHQYRDAISDTGMSSDKPRHSLSNRTTMEKKRAWYSSPYRIRRRKHRAITLAC